MNDKIDQVLTPDQNTHALNERNNENRSTSTTSVSKPAIRNRPECVTNEPTISSRQERLRTSRYVGLEQQLKADRAPDMERTINS